MPTLLSTLTRPAMARDYVEQVAVALIEQLKAGTAPWLRPWSPGEHFLPYNPTTGNQYHGMNAVWLLSCAETQGNSRATPRVVLKLRATAMHAG